MRRNTALVLAIVSILCGPALVDAGSGTVHEAGVKQGQIDLTIKFLYPPSEADLQSVTQSLGDVSSLLCDATEGQMRLGTVTITGGSSVNEDLADVVIHSEDGQASASLCLQAGACAALTQPGGRVNLYRSDLRAATLAHELGHLVFDLGDEYDEQNYQGACWGIGYCIECDDVDDHNTCLMQQQDCGVGGGEGTELCRADNHDPVLGDPMLPACTPENQISCPIQPCVAGCGLFNPQTCRFDLSYQSAHSFQKFGQILDCWSHLTLTYPFLDNVQDQPEPDPHAICSTAPEVIVDIEAPDQVFLVLDRSWSMNFLPDTGQCVGAGCPEICANNYDDDQDGVKDEAGCQNKQTRLAFLKQAAQAFLDLNRPTAMAGDIDPEIGVVGFSCASQLHAGLQEADDANYNNNLLPAILGLTPNGNTAIGDALAFAAGQFPDDDGSPNRAVLLITDGHQNCGAQTPAAAAALLEAEGIRVYTITMGEAANDDVLGSVAEVTRGRHVNSGKDRDLVAAFVQQWAHYRNAGLLIPKLRYRFSSQSGQTETAAQIRGPRSWLQGQYGPVSDYPEQAQPRYRSSQFQFQVEPGTQRFVVSLAGDMETMTGFGVRAKLQGPAGPHPAAYDTSAAPAAYFEILDGAFYRLLIVNEPNPGLWRLEVLPTGKVGHSAVQTGKVTVVAESSRTDLYTSLDRKVVTAPGQPVRLIARPVHKTQLQGVTLEAQVRRPDGTYHVLPLTGGKDFMTNFLGTIVNFPLQGHYEVRVYLRTDPRVTRNNPGESISTGPANTITVPLLERTAVEYFYVKTGTPPCGAGSTGNCYTPVPQ
jgi:hypothetical protein